MCCHYLHQGKPFFKHLELKTCGWHNGRHSENFHCRVWARITILVSSYKSYDYMSPLEGQVHHIGTCSYIYHACTGIKSWFPHPRSTILDWEKLENKEWALIRGSWSKGNWEHEDERHKHWKNLMEHYENKKKQKYMTLFWSLSLISTYTNLMITWSHNSQSRLRYDPGKPK